MEIRTLQTKEEMLTNFQLLLEVYPKLELEAYSNELDHMLPHNYGQTCVYKDGICVALTGYWIGYKLWCGKYMELDNVVVSAKERSSGIGDTLFDYMKNFAEREECTMLALDSYTDNFKAHKFFYKKGYIPRGFHFIQVLQPERVR